LGFEFLARVVRTSALVAPLIAIFLATYVSPSAGSGFLLGALWGILNLLAVISIVRAMFGSDDPGTRRVISLALLKFPVLYGAGFLLIRCGAFPLTSLVSGFSLILSVILLKAVGAVVTERMSSKKYGIYA